MLNSSLPTAFSPKQQVFFFRFAVAGSTVASRGLSGPQLATVEPAAGKQGKGSDKRTLYMR